MILNQFYFFFYEGNDLEENLKEFELTKKKFQNINQYVNFKINNNILIKKKDIVDANFPIIKFLNSIKKQLVILFKDIFNSEDTDKILNEILNRLNKLKGENVILANKDLLGNKKKDYWTNKTRDEKIKNIRPIESAVGDLSNNQIKLSLEIFFESIMFLKKWEKKDNIKIIFLPSPSTTYEWNNPIKYYPRYSKGNLDYKEITIDENNNNNIFLREKIELFSNQYDIEFIDLTNAIKEKAKTNVLHGPIDWVHFNKLGYEFIANNL